LSRVFDALQKTGRGGTVSPNLLPTAAVEVAAGEFRIEGLPVARTQLIPESPLVFHAEPHSPAAERYRLLRLRLQTIRQQSDIRTILITSPGPQEGKSTFALNLASALAEKKDQSVLLLEADLRCPSLASGLGLKLGSGLTQCERNDKGWQSVIWKIDPLEFYLLPAGRATHHPSEILNSEWFALAKQKLASSFDWVLIDSPPVIPVSDTMSLKERADAVFVIARADRTQRSAIDETIRLLGKDRILGIILNGLQRLDRGYYDYHRYYAPKSSNGNSTSGR
jgi:protein-tyrosine kinase